MKKIVVHVSVWRGYHWFRHANRTVLVQFIHQARSYAEQIGKGIRCVW